MKYAEQKHQYVKLFSNCFITRGMTRSILVDGYRGGFNFIPNDLGDFLEEAELASLEQLYIEYGVENQDAIDEYLDFLLKNEYIFFASAQEKDCFPAFSTQWEYPGQIANAILDIGQEESYNLGEVLHQLDKLQCQALQLRVFSPKTVDWIENLLQHTTPLTFESINLFLAFDETMSDDFLKYLALAYQKTASIVVHGAPYTRQIQDKSVEKLATLLYIETPLQDETHCGVVLPVYFSANLMHYTESLTANSCLNRKISVDRHGYIKNCPSMTEQYGHINTVSLRDALHAAGFKDKWGIKKDQIEICQVCEFRHICTDCRAYLADGNNVYSKPAKCSYDPYTGVWN